LQFSVRPNRTARDSSERARRASSLGFAERISSAPGEKEKTMSRLMACATAVALLGACEQPASNDLPDWAKEVVEHKTHRLDSWITEYCGQGASVNRPGNLRIIKHMIPNNLCVEVALPNNRSLGSLIVDLDSIVYPNDPLARSVSEIGFDEYTMYAPRRSLWNTTTLGGVPYHGCSVQAVLFTEFLDYSGQYEWQGIRNALIWNDQSGVPFHARRLVISNYQVASSLGQWTGECESYPTNSLSDPGTSQEHRLYPCPHGDGLSGSDVGVLELHASPNFTGYWGGCWRMRPGAIAARLEDQGLDDYFIGWRFKVPASGCQYIQLRRDEGLVPFGEDLQWFSGGTFCWNHGQSSGGVIMYPGPIEFGVSSISSSHPF
jgi:hypothetical protein